MGIRISDADRSARDRRKVPILPIAGSVGLLGLGVGLVVARKAKLALVVVILTGIVMTIIAIVTSMVRSTRKFTRPRYGPHAIALLPDIETASSDPNVVKTAWKHLTGKVTSGAAEEATAAETDVSGGREITIRGHVAPTRESDVHKPFFKPPKGMHAWNTRRMPTVEELTGVSPNPETYAENVLEGKNPYDVLEHYSFPADAAPSAGGDRKVVVPAAAADAHSESIEERSLDREFNAGGARSAKEVAMNPYKRILPM